MPEPRRLTSEEIWQLRRLSTPTVYNGWERITAHDPVRDGFNLETATDFAPAHGAVAGRAVTLAVRVSGPAPSDNRQRWAAFRRFVLEQGPGPTVVVIEDLDKPMVFGSVWGEIATSTFRALGCVGAIVDGGVRDVDETAAAGFKVLARRACVGHGVGALATFGEAVTVFGRRVTTGQLVHADRHGFLAVPPEDERELLEVARWLDAEEATLLASARHAGIGGEAFLRQFELAIDGFVDRTRRRFAREGEWS